MSSDVSDIFIANRCIKSASHSPLANIGCRMRHVEDLSDFRHRKSVCEMSVLLDLPCSILIAVILKWKCLRATTAQPRNSKPADTTDFQTETGSNTSIRTVCRGFNKWSAHCPPAHRCPSPPLTFPFLSSSCLGFSFCLQLLLLLSNCISNEKTLMDTVKRCLLCFAVPDSPSL